MSIVTAANLHVIIIIIIISNLSVLKSRSCLQLRY